MTLKHDVEKAIGRGGVILIFPIYFVLKRGHLEPKLMYFNQWDYRKTFFFIKSGHVNIILPKKYNVKVGIIEKYIFFFQIRVY